MLSVPWSLSAICGACEAFRVSVESGKGTEIVKPISHVKRDLTCLRIRELIHPPDHLRNAGSNDF